METRTRLSPSFTFLCFDLLFFFLGLYFCVPFVLAPLKFPNFFMSLFFIFYKYLYTVFLSLQEMTFAKTNEFG
ncbi:hypothetical protein DsansV1_C06g0066301 [Dioscorea sansibarensis]